MGATPECVSVVALRHPNCSAYKFSSVGDTFHLNTKRFLRLLYGPLLMSRLLLFIAFTDISAQLPIFHVIYDAHVA